MGQIKVIKQDEQVDLGVTGTNYGDAVSLDGALTVAAQVVISNSAALNSCAVVLQMSNDPLDETPQNWNDYGSSQNITANGNLLLEKVNPTGTWIRTKLTAPTGSFDADTTIVVKGPN